MNWDPAWEQVFRTRDWGRYPPEELIRFVARHFYSAPDRGQIKILEIGCGTGANIWYLAREGFDAYGIDGSSTAIAKATRRLDEEGLKTHLQVGDIAALDDVFPTHRFDAVIDVGCLSCNGLGTVKSVLGQALAMLKPQGRLFAMLIAAGSCGDGSGREVEPGTFIDIQEGPLSGIGRVHFFTLEEVQQLLQPFSGVQIECSSRSLNDRQQWDKLWVVEGVKGEVPRS